MKRIHEKPIKKNMCLAIPGRIVSIKPSVDPAFRSGKVSFGGVLKQVNLCMVPEAGVDDYVLVHVGVAIGTVDEEEARITFEYLRRIGELEEIGPSEEKADAIRRRGGQSRETAST